MSIGHLRIRRMLFGAMRQVLFSANAVGMTEFSGEVGRNMRNLVRETDGKGSQNLCGGHALVGIGRAHTMFGRQKLQKRKKLHNKLSMYEMHCMSQRLS
jgi:hypothetical protein